MAIHPRTEEDSSALARGLTDHPEDSVVQHAAPPHPRNEHGGGSRPLCAGTAPRIYGHTSMSRIYTRRGTECRAAPWVNAPRMDTPSLGRLRVFHDPRTRLGRMHNLHGMYYLLPGDRILTPDSEAPLASARSTASPTRSSKGMGLASAASGVPK